MALYFLVTIFSVLSAALAISVSIPKDVYEVARGDNVTIPCSFKSTLILSEIKVLTVHWARLAKNPQDPASKILDYYYPANELDINAKYEGRVGFVSKPETGDVSIYLSKVTLEDSGFVECAVNIAKDNSGVNTRATNLLVLVAPSKPLCSLEGKAEYGQDLRLKCFSEEGSPPPVYKWTSYDVRNTLRPDPPKSKQENGMMTLLNVSMDTSGFFICTSSNKISSSSCNITLAVMPPSMNIAMTAGIIGASIVALIIIAIVVYCCCCRTTRPPKEYEMEVPREEPKPQKNTEEYCDEKTEPPHNGDMYYVDDEEEKKKEEEEEEEDEEEEEEEEEKENERSRTPMMPPSKPQDMSHSDS
ncbi:cell surface A33 antigen-like [Polyodon spathula]|uniref:cell surface A33 antigen-like n=1 Tax=Polyodon spathula TaxID=7913 RepID=UPI001B7EDF1E|nr:cell surface A33 antigen-like [Polyodon spathula]